MGNPRLVDAFRALPIAAQIETLVHLIYELTIVARDTYEPSSLELRYPQRLRYLNEVQHRIAGHVLALLTGDPGRYPDDVLASMILEADDPELHRQIAAAFARSLSQQAVTSHGI